MMFAKIPLTPRGCLFVGVVLLFVCALHLVIVIFQPRSLLKRRWLRPRWGYHSPDAPVSRIGGAAWGLAFGAFGATSILNGYLAVLPNSRVLPILFGAFGLVLAAGVYDSWLRKRKRPA
jgi:formate-dependent nitrite reductase membrane component NrfD